MFYHVGNLNQILYKFWCINQVHPYLHLRTRDLKLGNITCLTLSPNMIMCFSMPLYPPLAFSILLSFRVLWDPLYFLKIVLRQNKGSCSIWFLWQSKDEQKWYWSVFRLIDVSGAHLLCVMRDGSVVRIHFFSAMWQQTHTAFPHPCSSQIGIRFFPQF